MEYLLQAILFIWAMVWLLIVADTLADIICKPQVVKEWFDSPMYNMNNGYWWKSIVIWLAVAVVAIGWPIIVIYKGVEK